MSNRPNTVLNNLFRGMAVCAAAFVCMAAQAQNAIEAVTASIQGGVEVIRIDTTQPLQALPGGFSIQTPARIALDFPGVTNVMGRPSVEVNQGNVRSVNVVQAGDRSRLVLNLKQATNYRAENRGKSLFVSLDPVATPSAASTASSVT